MCIRDSILVVARDRDGETSARANEHIAMVDTPTFPFVVAHQLEARHCLVCGTDGENAWNDHLLGDALIMEQGLERRRYVDKVSVALELDLCLVAVGDPERERNLRNRDLGRWAETVRAARHGQPCVREVIEGVDL